MPTLQLKFAVRLGGRASEIRPPGPIFHRWLPNGESDAIELPVPDPDVAIRVWFDRRGFVRDGREIIYNERRNEVDPELMARQGAVFAGILWGDMAVDNVGEEDYQRVTDRRRKNTDGSDEDYYLNLGKRIYRPLYEAVSEFLNILRYPYGQHWIEVPEPWDSRTMSLGHYIGVVFNLQWTPDGGAMWEDFQPTPNVIHVVGSADVDHFWQYITPEDWTEIRELAQAGYLPSVAATVLSRAHQLRDDNNLRHALIEGVTALEIAVGEYLEQQLRRTTALERASLQLRGSAMALPGRFAAAMVNHQVNDNDVDHVLAAIRTRNDLVHESAELPPNADDQLDALLRVTASFFTGPLHRFPFPTVTGGAWLSEDLWAEEYAKWEAAQQDSE